MLLGSSAQRIMADTGIDDLREDLPMSMAIAAFTGISWFIGAEINTSLFILFKRRRGLYFWSAALCSWGVVLQPLFIILADYGIWGDFKGSITMIYLTWVCGIGTVHHLLPRRVGGQPRDASRHGLIVHEPPPRPHQMEA